MVMSNGDNKRVGVVAPEAQGDSVLKRQLGQVAWGLQYGKVSVQIREGHVSLITIERTIKVD